MQKERARGLRGLTIFLMLIFSLVTFLPFIEDYGEAVSPTFERPNVLVDHGPGLAMMPFPGGPAIAADGNTLYAVWSDNRIGTWGIFFTKSSDGGATWTMERRIDGNNFSNNYAPSIAVDTSGGPSTGNIYIVWQYRDGNLADIYAMRSIDGGINWTDRRKVDTAVSNIGSTSPQVVVDVDGKVYVAFQDKRAGTSNIYVSRSDNYGVTWLREIRVSSGNLNNEDPSISVHSSVICVGWRESGTSPSEPWGTNIRIGTSTTFGSSWRIRKAHSVPSGVEDARSVSVVVGPPWTGLNWTIHASWVLIDGNGVSNVVYSQSTDMGVSWTQLVVVDDAPSNPSFTIDDVTLVQSSHILYTFWSDNREGDGNIYVSWSEDNGLTWGDGIIDNDVRVDDTDDNGVSIDDATEQSTPFALSGATGIYVVWSDRRDAAAYHVYFASYELDVIITEIRDSPDGLEQIEIFNQGSKVVNLLGWTLVVDGVPVDLGSLTSIFQGSYIVIGDDPATSTLIVDITLGDEGGSVQLIDSSGVLRDSVSYGQMGLAPDPIDSESIERVFLNFKYMSSWARASVPSFNLQNLAITPINQPKLVLNEILFNTVNPDDRFIELYLKSGGSLDITNHILVGDATYLLPAVTLTQTDPYYVIRPTQAPSLFNLMGATGDNIYLYNPSGAFMDMTGWSSSHSQDMSMVRIPDGFGSANGYDDDSSTLAGWQFDKAFSLPFVLIGPKQGKGGDLGDRIFYRLNVTNAQSVASYVNIVTQLGAQSWPISLYDSSGMNPLSDSPGDPDIIPDVGLVSPGGKVEIQVAVDIPPILQEYYWENGFVKAIDASDPGLSSYVVLNTTIFAHVCPTTSANPVTIYSESSPARYQPKETTLLARITGRGTPAMTPKPQDTVLLIDSSGSMASNDPTYLRRDAAKHYVDLLMIPDRAAVVDFDDDAILVGGDHLSTDYVRIKSNIDLIDSVGGTNILLAITLGNDELIGYGNASHKWIEILLTDGYGGTEGPILAEAQRAANNGITIFTIGLGSSVNDVLLQNIANITGGIYLKAAAADDLNAIYDLIGETVRNLAGYDNDITDDIPMVSVVLPDYINYIPGTAFPTPDYITQISGETNIQWNISKLNINETWTARLNVTSSQGGIGLPAMVYPDSKVTYIRHDDTQVTIAFPEPYIDVLAPTPLPDYVVLSPDMTLSPPPPYIEDDLVFVNATVHNLGDIDSPVSVVRFYDGIPPAPQIGADRPLPSIPVGGMESVSLLWTAAPRGNHTICVSADPDDNVLELDENNNTACIDLFVEAKPDYELTQAQPFVSKTVGLSKPVELSIRVYNNGPGDAKNDSILAFFLESTPTTPFRVYTVSPLLASEVSQEYTATWTSPATPGIYHIVAKVDYYDDIVEQDENNNNFIWIITVVRGPITNLVIGEPNYTSVSTYITSSTPLDFTVADRSGTGIKRTMYRIDGGPWENYTANGQFTLLEEGEHSLEWFSEDFVDNEELASIRLLRVDNTPPSTLLQLSTPRYFGNNIFITSSSLITLESSDTGPSAVGLDSIKYRIASGSWSLYSSSFTITGNDGAYLIEFFSTDFLGNVESVNSFYIILDNTPPTTTIDYEEFNITTATEFKLSATDGGSGVKTTFYRVDDDDWTTYSESFTLSEGWHNISFRSIDNLDHEEAEKTIRVNIPGPPPAEYNYKPLVALVFAIILVIVGLLSARAKPWKGEKDKEGIAKSFVIFSLPFVITEVATGIVSLFTGLLAIPPLLGIGTAVDLAILLAGIAVSIFWAKKMKPLPGQQLRY